MTKLNVKILTSAKGTKMAVLEFSNCYNMATKGQNITNHTFFDTTLQAKSINEIYFT